MRGCRRGSGFSAEEGMSETWWREQVGTDSGDKGQQAEAPNSSSWERGRVQGERRRMDGAEVRDRGEGMGWNRLRPAWADGIIGDGTKGGL